MNTVTVLGIDLAKNIFQLHGNDKNGKTVLLKKLKRDKLSSFISNMPACLIGMEACASAHYWARQFEGMGHRVRLIAPQFVKPFVKSNKNDAADAEAIAEAVSRPNMRFVPIKQAWQQDIQCAHRIRSRLVRARTALTNEVHGLLVEYGIVLPKVQSKFITQLAILVAPESDELSMDAKQNFQWLIEELKQINERIAYFDEKIERLSKSNELCRRLQTIPGVGPLSATAILSAVADASLFRNGRQFSAWLGLVPRQSSSGGKNVLLGISKRGDAYIRCLLVHGARAALTGAARLKAPDRLRKWALGKQISRGKNKAVVALANKNARMIWALMSSGRQYESKPY